MHTFFEIIGWTFGIGVAVVAIVIAFLFLFLVLDGPGVD